MGVLIESDWNLKPTCSRLPLRPDTVLIESDWNLKTIGNVTDLLNPPRINRIRLEFKGM